MELNDSENFVDIPDYENLYQVSDFGRLKILSKNTVSKNGKIMNFKEKIVNPKPHKSGYVRFHLTKNGETKTYSAHVIVASMFIKNKHKFTFVNHKDGVKWNNHKSNLEWNSSSMNNKHAIDTGLNPILTGENGRSSKLKDNEVFEIREFWKNKTHTQSFMAIKYNVDQSTISKIVNNKERIK